LLGLTCWQASILNALNRTMLCINKRR
jgi:hypothetical protein